MDLRFLHGRWHIVFTDFPMWLKGDRTSPSLNYAPAAGARELHDTVEYLVKGRTRTIKGIDRLVGEGSDALSFAWRGRGLLWPLRSRWSVEFVGPDRDWMMLGFEASLLTPAGHDIVSRHPMPSAAIADAMLSTFARLHPGTALQRLPR